MTAEMSPRDVLDAQLVELNTEASSLMTNIFRLEDQLEKVQDQTAATIRAIAQEESLATNL